MNLQLFSSFNYFNNKSNSFTHILNDVVFLKKYDYEVALISIRHPAISIEKRNYIQDIYVYISIIENINSIFSKPLLKIAKVNSENYSSFNLPQYFTINSRRIKNIKIEILDKENNPVDFQIGDTVVEIHIREKSLDG